MEMWRTKAPHHTYEGETSRVYFVYRLVTHTYIHIFGQCFVHVSFFFVCYKLYLCVHFNCVYDCCIFLCPSRSVSWPFVSVLYIYYKLYGGISFHFFFLSNFIISSHRIIFYFARFRLQSFSLSHFSLSLALFFTYAPVAYLCQSTNEEKIFFFWIEQLNRQYSKVKHIRLQNEWMKNIYRKTESSNYRHSAKERDRKK